MSGTEDTFSIGDVIEWAEWRDGRRTNHRGSVVFVGRTIKAKSDSDGHEMRFYHRKHAPHYDCRKVDLAGERWHRDLEEWWEARPKTRALELTPTLHFEGAIVSMAGPTHLRSVRASLEAMEQIADEAHAIREWLRKRPAEPSS